MGVFSTRDFVNESYNTVDLLDESIDITNAGNIEDGAMGMIIAETEANYTAMMKTIGICELAAIEQEGEAIYEASDVSGFFGKIKEFFKNILEKIKRLFKNFLVKFDSWTKSNKDFVTKYKKQLIAAKTKDLKFEGFVYKIEGGGDVASAPAEFKDDQVASALSAVNSANSTAINAILAEADADKMVSAVKGLDGIKDGSSDDEYNSFVSALDKIDENYDDIMEALRGNMFAKSKGKLTSEEYTQELFKYYRNGEETKSELEDSDINITNLMSILLNYNTVKKTVTDAYNKIDKGIGKFTKSLDRAENNLLKEIPGQKDDTTKTYSPKKATNAAVRAISVMNKVVKDHQQLWTQMSNAHLRAIKDQASQAKAICTKLLTRKPTKEGADLIGDDEGSYGVTHSDAFGNLKFI